MAKEPNSSRVKVDSSSTSNAPGDVTASTPSSTSQLLAQAEKLKAQLPGDGHVVANDTRLALLDLYTQILLSDLEVALEKRIEQDLWNNIFKQPITELQSQIRDKKNPRRAEAQVTLGLLLDQSTGFYVSLFGALCQTFSVSLPCRRRLSNTFQESGNRLPGPPVVLAPRSVVARVGGASLSVSSATPSRGSVSSVCQHCLVHLGDVARYYQQVDQAAHYYTWAVLVDPVSGGHPYNQLAILEAAKNRRLSSIYFYMRAIACPNPFPAAATNLDKMLDRLAREPIPILQPLSSSPSGTVKTPLATAYLEFFALVYLHKNLPEDLAKAKSLWDRFSACLPPSIRVFTGRELGQIAALHTFLLHSHLQQKATARQQKSTFGSGGTGNNSREPPWTRLLLHSTVSLVSCLCQAAVSKQVPSSSSVAIGTHCEGESITKALHAALLVLFVWYRASVKALASSKSKESGGCASPPFPENVAQYLNQLALQYSSNTNEIETDSDQETEHRNVTAIENKILLDSITLERLMQLPEFKTLQGFIPLSLPTSPSKPNSPENSTSINTTEEQGQLPQTCSAGDSLSPSSRHLLRGAGLLWCARSLANALPGLLSCQPTVNNEDVEGVVVFTAVRPPSPPMPSPGLLMGGPPSMTVARGQAKRNVAIESIMQNQQQQNIQQSALIATTTNVKTTATPLLPATPQPVQKSTTLSQQPSQKQQQSLPQQPPVQQPGLIIHDNIARFIQEQAAQVNSPTTGHHYSNHHSNKSSAVGVGGHHHASLDTGGLTSSSVLNNDGLQSMMPGNGGDQRGVSRHLYNENREQFQRNLPPRFARLHHSQGQGGLVAASTQVLPPQQPDLTGKETDGDAPLITAPATSTSTGVSSGGGSSLFGSTAMFGLRDFPGHHPHLHQQHHHPHPLIPSASTSAVGTHGLSSIGGMLSSSHAHAHSQQHPQMMGGGNWAWPLDRFCTHSGMQPQAPAKFLYEPSQPSPQPQSQTMNPLTQSSGIAKTAASSGSIMSRTKPSQIS